MNESNEASAIHQTPDAPGAELDMLAAAYPAFKFSLQGYGRHGVCCIAVRKNGADAGLHTCITQNLNELHAALVLDAVQSGHRPARSRKPSYGTH